MWIAIALGVLGAAVGYLKDGFSEKVFRLLAWSAVAGVLLFSLSIVFDERKKVTAIRTYIVDFLDNVCAYRYEKQTPVASGENIEPDVNVLENVFQEEEKHEKPSPEIMIREILEEFLA